MRRIAFLLFTIGWGANHFGALLLVYRGALHLDPSTPQALFGVYALGLVPGLLLSGPLSDRFGRRALVFPAAILSLVASALLGVGGEHVALLFVGRFLYGVGCGAVMNPGAVWILELSSDGAGARRATIALSAGFGFGPLLSGALAQWAPHPMLLPYLVHCAALAAAIVLALPTQSNSPRTRRPLLAFPVTRPFLTGIAPMAPFVFGFAVIAFAALPAMLGPDALGGAPIAFIGLVGAVGLGAGVLVQPLTRKLDPTRAGRIGLAIGAAGCALAAFAVDQQLSPLLLVVTAVMGVAYGMTMTAGLRGVELLSKPETRGALTGLYYVLTYVGFALPYGLAIATRSIAPSTALLGVAALALLAAVALRSPAWTSPTSSATPR